MTPEELKPLVTEAVALAEELSGLAAKNNRLDELKEILRNAADGQDATFTGTMGETATVKQIRDGIARSIGGKLLGKVLQLAGDKLWNFFRLAPIPGKELEKKDLRVQVLSDLHKAKAKALLEAITVPGTARVSFDS